MTSNAENRRLGLKIAIVVAVMFAAPILAKLAGVLKEKRTRPWGITEPSAAVKKR